MAPQFQLAAQSRNSFLDAKQTNTTGKNNLADGFVEVASEDAVPVAKEKKVVVKEKKTTTTKEAKE